ncbi:MAG: anti-sigma factor RsbA family regulatory protein [Actinomycetes bacterium]
MPMNATLTDSRPGDLVGFRHEAVFYDGDDGFLKAVASFVRDGVANGESVLVVVGAVKIDVLRDELRGESDGVMFADMNEVGRNPARIIPAWRDFLDRNAVDGRGVRGVGEPVWAARTPAELVECQRHEALLNIAFAGSGNWSLLCPYDTTSLSRGVLDEAARSHPFVADDAGERRSPDYRAEHMPTRHLAAELPAPARYLEELVVAPDALGRLRAVVAARGKQFGLDQSRVDDLILAVHEIAANSVFHGGGAGIFRLWRDGKSLVCEIRDSGRLNDPLVGREHPELDGDGGRGLWLANQLCDLVQMRSYPSGTVVRLHTSLDNG